MVRSQGLSVLNQVRSSIENVSDPTEPLAHGAMILFSGALLLTPGFFTDGIGFALLVPGVRGRIFNAIRSRVRIVTAQRSNDSKRDQADGVIIDAEYEDLDAPHPKGPSGWTQH